MNKENRADVMSDWKAEFTKRIQLECKSRKDTFTFYDAWQKTKYHTKRDKVFCRLFLF